jgi:hypothetical protein
MGDPRPVSSTPNVTDVALAPSKNDNAGISEAGNTGLPGAKNPSAHTSTEPDVLSAHVSAPSPAPTPEIATHNVSSLETDTGNQVGEVGEEFVSSHLFHTVVCSPWVQIQKPGCLRCTSAGKPCLSRIRLMPSGDPRLETCGNCRISGGLCTLPLAIPIFNSPSEYCNYLLPQLHLTDNSHLFRSIHWGPGIQTHFSHNFRVGFWIPYWIRLGSPSKTAENRKGRQTLTRYCGSHPTVPGACGAGTQLES